MNPRPVRIGVGVVLVLVVGVGLVLVGRATVDTGAVRTNANRAGHDAGYREGLAVGQASGRQEGRALQASAMLPSASRTVARASFDAGYVAGANDVFAGYDGGWSLSTPYVVVLQHGTNGIAYRIASRVERWTPSPAMMRACPTEPATSCLRR